MFVSFGKMVILYDLKKSSEILKVHRFLRRADQTV
jgi:hypothetical protein